MMERWKREKNKKGEWRNNKYLWWSGNRRWMEKENLWIGDWMRKNEREREGGFVEDERERVG